MRPQLQLNIRPKPEDLEHIKELAARLNTTIVDALRQAVLEKLKRVRRQQKSQVAA